MLPSCLKLVPQGLVGPVPEKALDMAQRAQHKSEYLGHLIKDLLSLSAIKAARDITKTEIDLRDVVKTVFEDVQPHAAEKNLKPGDVIVDIDLEEVRSPDDVTDKVEKAKDEGYRVVTVLV